MDIYKNKTFQIYNLNQIDFYKKKFSNIQINFFHPFEFLIWQGPNIINLINKKIRKKDNYIVETFDNIGLSLILMDFNIKNLSFERIVKKDKLYQLAQKKNINVYNTNKFIFSEVL